MNTQMPPLASESSTFTPLPSLGLTDGAVNPKDYVEKGTSSAVLLGYIATFFGILIGGVCSYGILWIVLIIAPIVDYFNRKKTMAMLRGTGIEVGPHQLPEIYACAINYAQRLGMTAPPAIFIVEGNTINAAAMKIGSRKVIVLIDDAVDACLRSGEPQTIAFFVGHELAHHALNHTSLIRATIKQYMRKLSRLDEFSCDAIANQLVGSPRISARALTTLATGPQLLQYVNLAQLRMQAIEVSAYKHSIKAEKRLTHPLILRRIQRFL
jgi:Zn-dependent protease with chaperone function